MIRKPRTGDHFRTVRTPLRPARQGPSETDPYRALADHLSATRASRRERLSPDLNRAPCPRASPERRGPGPGARGQALTAAHGPFTDVPASLRGQTSGPDIPSPSHEVATSNRFTRLRRGWRALRIIPW